MHRIAKAQWSGRAPTSREVSVHDFDATEDQRRAEQRFAYQLVRAMDGGYDVSWTDDSDILIVNPVTGSEMTVPRTSFMDDPAQAADAVRRVLDVEQAARDRPIDVQRDRLRVLGRCPRRVPGSYYPSARSTYYRSVQGSYFKMGGDHICYSSG